MSYEKLRLISLGLIILGPIIWAACLAGWNTEPPTKYTKGPLALVGTLILVTCVLYGDDYAATVFYRAIFAFINVITARVFWVDLFANLRQRHRPTNKQLIGGPGWTLLATMIAVLLLSPAIAR